MLDDLLVGGGPLDDFSRKDLLVNCCPRFFVLFCLQGIQQLLALTTEGGCGWLVVKNLAYTARKIFSVGEKKKKKKATKNIIFNK